MLFHSVLKPLVALVLAVVVAGSCRSRDPLAIEPGGSLEVQVYLDRDGDLNLSPSIDELPSGVDVAVVRLSGAPVATARTGTDGIARFTRVPVGTYNLALTAAAAGDSLIIVGEGPHRVSIAEDAAATATLALDHPLVTASAVQTLPIGRPVVARGTALHQTNVFGDSILHIRDATGAARLVVPAPGAAGALGDDLRVVGRIGVSRGRPAIVNARLFVLQSGGAPEARLASTATANSADAAKLDAELVEVRNAAVVSHGQVGNAPAMEVNDGTGNLVIVFEPSAVVIQGQWLPFEQVDLTGVLVPVEPGRWALKPRSADDVRRE